MDLITILILSMIILLFTLVSIVLSSVIAKFLVSKTESEITNIKENQTKLNEQLTKVINYKHNDYKELKEKIESLEEKVNVLTMPEGKLKEIQMEKLRIGKKD
ncbi:MAG: hypothetical protein QXZ13_04030 [Candidatus Diapherotrites archaeon]